MNKKAKKTGPCEGTSYELQKILLKSKSYKDSILLWPNIDCVVGEVERYLGMLKLPGDDLPLVPKCAVSSAKASLDIEYTDSFTYQKLVVFCQVFRHGLLTLGKYKIACEDEEWDPDSRQSLVEFCGEGVLSAEKRAKPVVQDAYKRLIEGWIYEYTDIRPPELG